MSVIAYSESTEQVLFGSSYSAHTRLSKDVAAHMYSYTLSSRNANIEMSNDRVQGVPSALHPAPASAKGHTSEVQMVYSGEHTSATTHNVGKDVCLGSLLQHLHVIVCCQGHQAFAF